MNAKPMTLARWIGYAVTMLLALAFAAGAVYAHLGNRQMMGIMANENYAKFWAFVALLVVAAGIGWSVSRRRPEAITLNFYAMVFGMLSVSVAPAAPLFFALSVLCFLSAIAIVVYVPKNRHASASARISG